MYKNVKKTKSGFTYCYHGAGDPITCHLDNPGDAIISLNPSDEVIMKKVSKFCAAKGFPYMQDRILP